MKIKTNTVQVCEELDYGFNWWLVKVILEVTFGFLLQNFRRWQIVLCHSMNAGSVKEIPWGGGDTQTLPYAKEFDWTSCTHRQGNAKTLSVNACIWAQALVPSPAPGCKRMHPSYLVKFPLPNFSSLSLPIIKSVRLFCHFPLLNL